MKAVCAGQYGDGIGPGEIGEADDTGVVVWILEQWHTSIITMTTMRLVAIFGSVGPAAREPPGATGFLAASLVPNEAVHNMHGRAEGGGEVPGTGEAEACVVDCLCTTIGCVAGGIGMFVARCWGWVLCDKNG